MNARVFRICGLLCLLVWLCSVAWQAYQRHRMEAWLRRVLSGVEVAW